MGGERFGRAVLRCANELGVYVEWKTVMVWVRCSGKLVRYCILLYPSSLLACLFSRTFFSAEQCADYPRQAISALRAENPGIPLPRVLITVGTSFTSTA